MCLLFIYLLACTPTHLHKCNDLLAFIIKEKEKTNNNQNQKLTSEKFLIRGKQRKESERDSKFTVLFVCSRACVFHFFMWVTVLNGFVFALLF